MLTVTFKVEMTVEIFHVSPENSFTSYMVGALCYKQKCRGFETR
jgi:hypothetical protein